LRTTENRNLPDESTGQLIPDSRKPSVHEPVSVNPARHIDSVCHEYRNRLSSVCESIEVTLGVSRVETPREFVMVSWTQRLRRASVTGT